MIRLPSSPAIRFVVLALGAATAYFAGARAGYALQIPGSIATLWPPAGIMLAILILARRGDWPAVIAGGMLGSFASDVLSGYPIALAGAASIANLTESAVAALILQRGGQRPTLHTLRGVLRFVGIAVLASNAVTALGGALVLHLTTGMPWATAWLVWWVGDGLGMLTVAPVILTWLGAVPDAAVTRGRLVEAVILALLLAGVGLMTLGGGPPWILQSGLYVAFPLLLWSALRFGPRGAASGVLLVALLVTWSAARGADAFLVQGGAEAHVVAWWAYTFLAVTSLTALVPAAILEERRTALANLADSEVRYRTVVQAATDAILTIDEHSRIVFANQAVETTFGHPVSELIGRPLTELMPPDFRERHQAALARYVATGVRHIPWRGIELTGRHRDGHDIPLEVSFGEIVLNGRRHFTGVVRDVTERHRAAAALRAAEERMRFALEASRVGIWEADLTTGTVRWSATLEALHGIPEGTFGGTFDDFAALIDEADRPAALGAITRTTREHADSTILYRTTWPDGSVHWLSGAGRTFFANDGTPLRAAGVGMDVTEQRRLEEQYRQAQKMESIGQLASGIAHDFNNLLAVILGYAGLVRRSLDAASPAQADMAEIVGAAERATTLTRQLLAFGRKQILAPRVLDLADVVNSVEPLLHRLLGEDIEIHVRAADRLGHVLADPGQLEQVLINLAVNARDAMPDGGVLLIELSNIELGAAYERKHIDVAAGRYVMLAVSDTGAGMPPGVAQRIFEPFFTTKAAGEGTGLGLATVYGIVKQSGGGILVYSELGHGTTFKVYLPRTDDRVDSVSETPRDDPRPATETILLVEDDAGVRQVAQRILTQRGYRVVTAATPTEALEAALTLAAPIDLLLTDVVLPEMGGRVLADRIAALRPATKVVYMSGYTDDAVVRRGVLQRETHFVQKPFSEPDLLRKVREALDGPVVR